RRPPEEQAAGRRGESEASSTRPTATTHSDREHAAMLVSKTANGLAVLGRAGGLWFGDNSRFPRRFCVAEWKSATRPRRGPTHTELAALDPSDHFSSFLRAFRSYFSPAFTSS